MAVDKSSYYKWDSKLKLSNEDFDLNKSNYDTNAAKEVAFPSDYTLAIFAELAYEDKYYSLPQDWELLTTATNTDKRNGYHGVAFYNPKLCQVVIAHRGTVVSNPGALLSDAQLALKQTKTRQSQSAATFVHKISERIKEKNESNGHCFQLSITGHSLGAWLAQVTTFSVKYLKRDGTQFVEDKEYLQNIHAHSVVFESPGCKETLTKLVKTFVPRYSHRKFGNYDILDMTVYLSKLNPINSINQHVGTIYYVVHAKTHSINEIRGLFDHNTHKIERKIVLDFQTGIYASCKLLIRKLLPISLTNKHFIEQPAKENEYSLNVFTENELDFVKDWFHITKCGSSSIQQFKDKNSLPDFEINYEYNTIAAENLHKAIACIKRLRPTKTIIFDLLKNEVPDKYYFEILKMEVEYFQKTLPQFHNYYFMDKYNLLEFLISKDRILHIRVNKDSEWEYELETSIVNNVIEWYQKNIPDAVEDYFKKDQCCFLTWNRLYKLRNFLFKILGKGTEKVNLLVIESFEESEIKEDILHCMKNCEAKVIIISTDQRSWREDNVKEITGVGDKIKFQDLTEDCQKAFMTQQILILNGKRRSLGDIINASFPFSQEVYEHINKAIPVQALLEHILRPSTEIVMDCSHNNLLTAVVFLQLYREIELKCLTKRYEDSLFIIQDKNDSGLSDKDRSVLAEAGKQIVKIESEINFEKECHANFNIHKIIYLITAEYGKYFVTKIFNNKFYIPRNIIHKRTVNARIFNGTDMDQYFFLEDKDKFKEMISYLNKERKEHFKFVGSAETAKELIKNTKINAHLLKMQNGNIFWLYSNGHMDSLRKYIQLNETSENESDITKKKIVIISGEPGMGKSSTISYLFFQLKQTHWVFAVPLKHSVFDDIVYEAVDFESAAKFILRNCGIDDINVLQHLLSYCLKNSTNSPIYLMFDGYDDIDEDNSRNKFTALINFLKDFSTANILITTRKYICRELENEISVFASQYEALEEETQLKAFLYSFCYSQLHVFGENNLTNEMQILVPSILNNAQIVFGETISNFIGMPMQIRMLTEILMAQKQSGTISMALVDIPGLYKKYIEMRCDIYFKRISLLNNQTVKKWFQEHIYDKLYKLAIIKMFNTRASIGYDDIVELNKVGLIQSDSFNDAVYEFLHDSVRDYFISYLLKLWLESCSEIIYYDWDLVRFLVSDFLVKGEFKETRFFLNYQLKNVRVISNRLERCQNKLKQLWERDQNLLFNNEESFFHICIRENLYFLIKDYLLKIVTTSNKTTLLSKRNADFETPLSIAIGMIYENQNNTENILLSLLEELDQWPAVDIKIVLLATLFTHNVSTNIELLDILNTHAKNYSNVTKRLKEIEPHFKQMKDFLDACKHNQLDKVNSILNQFQNDKISRDYLLLVTNKNKESCLHLTSSTEIVERLLKLGANKNSQDHHGMTPLTRAIKEGNPDIASILIRKGALFTADYVRNSPLYHAAKHNNLEIIKMLLHLKKPIKTSFLNDHNVFHVTALMIAAKNGHELVVQYLLISGANVSTADWNGMTAIYHAVKGNHTKLIRIFREYDADINSQDNNGITPLLYSIRKNRWPMVITLLDNGANINIRSGNIYPLKLLIEMDKKDLIKKVLNNMVKKTKKGIITREAANIEILSEEDKMYIRNLENVKTNK